MKLLFFGESWSGSSARSLKESLQRVANPAHDEVHEINEDLYFPRHRARWLRAIHRILSPAYRLEVTKAVIGKCEALIPHVFVVYKGSSVDSRLVEQVKKKGVLTVNVFPDYSPHAYGTRLRQAIGAYDLVISTKPFHPPLWKSLYGYDNRCVCVPHGYDDRVHLVNESPRDFEFDLGLVATWRLEYHNLMREVAALIGNARIRVAIAGNGWSERASEFPRDWAFPGEIVGAAYARWARRSKILIAPVHRDVVIDGQRQPGDEDSTRTYELAAAHCFFVHRRTAYVKSVYDEVSEVPLYDDAAELVRIVQYYLTRDELRCKMAAAAHARAVPAYSIDRRAEQVAKIIREAIDLRMAE